MSMSSSQAPLLTCLVPVRNGSSDLPGFLESVSLFCDAVIALDDGSTDDTYDILKGSSLVKLLLQNPRRETYQGWDDCRNRSTLLEAAATLSPQWLIWIDADERLPADEALALRAFLETSADPTHAYGFRIFPLRHDHEHFEDRYIWIYRLFHFSPGQVLEGRRLHLFPIPVQIPSSRWVRTTFRFQHLGGLTAERRRARVEKYRLADPNHDFQSDYSSLLREPPSQLPCWQARAVSLSPFWDGDPGAAAASLSPDAPTLSVFLLASEHLPSDRLRQLRAHVESMLHSPHQPSCELIAVQAVCSDGFLNGHVLNQALRDASGLIVCLVSEELMYTPQSFAALVDEHGRGFAMVSGVEALDSCPPNGLERSRSSGAVIAGVPRFCSWSRQALDEAGGFPPRLSLDGSELNARLIMLGFQAYNSPLVEIRFEAQLGP